MDYNVLFTQGSIDCSVIVVEERPCCNTEETVVYTNKEYDVRARTRGSVHACLRSCAK